MVLLPLCLVAVNVVAQTEFHWGFKGGVNLTTYSTDADDVQGHMGQWGALCRWKLNDRFAIQPELFYSRMGVRSAEKVLYYNEGYGYADNSKLNPSKFKLHLITDNIQLPIICKYYFRTQRLPEGLNIHLGPLFSQRFDYSISTVSPLGYLLDPAMSNGDSPVADLRDIARAQNHFTVQAVLGVGYDSPSGIGFDVRYQYGITPVFDNDHNACYDKKSRDCVIALCFSYVF